MPITTANLVAMFLLAAMGCGLLTSLWIRIARYKRIEDQPGQRRLHASPTPRGGGVAVAIVLLVATAWLAAETPLGSPWPGVVIGIAMFSGLGLLDDLTPVRASAKFALQLIAAAVLIATVSHAWSLHWAAAIGLAVACCYVVNIWNFMDGSNGLITVQALLIALALAFWPGQSDALRLAAMALAGGCAAFLPFNMPSAKVFLGDVGSHALGAAVFTLLLLSWHEGTVALGQALLMGTVLLLDTGYTLARRALARRRVWLAHREHLYQYAVRHGLSHARVCLYYAAWTTWSIFLAAAANGLRSSWVMWTLFMVNWLLGTWIYFGLRQRWLKARTHRGSEA